MMETAPDEARQAPFETLILWEQISFDMAIQIDEYHYTTHAQPEKLIISIH